MKILDNELDTETVLEIGKFTILWAEFEKKYCNNDCSSNAIWRCAIDCKIDDEILMDFSEKVKDRIHYCGLDDLDYIHHNLVPENARKLSVADLNTIQDFLSFTGENLLAGALLAIYRVRNNLLHGLKQINELNNQILLFTSMNQVLENIRRKEE